MHILYLVVGWKGHEPVEWHTSVEFDIAIGFYQSLTGYDRVGFYRIDLGDLTITMVGGTTY